MISHHTSLKMRYIALFYLVDILSETVYFPGTAWISKQSLLSSKCKNREGMVLCRKCNMGGTLKRKALYHLHRNQLQINMMTLARCTMILHLRTVKFAAFKQPQLPSIAGQPVIIYLVACIFLLPPTKHQPRSRSSF